MKKGAIPKVISGWLSVVETTTMCHWSFRQSNAPVMNTYWTAPFFIRNLLSYFTHADTRSTGTIQWPEAETCFSKHTVSVDPLRGNVSVIGY